MHKILEELNETPGAKGSMIVGKDGFVVVSNVMSGLEERTISAMVASIYSEIGRNLGEITKGELKAVSLYASGGNIFFSCSETFILAVITDVEVNVGLLRVKMRTGMERLRQMLGTF